MNGDKDRQGWWYAAWRWAGGDRTRLKSVRDVAAFIGDRPLWPLVRVELRMVDTRSDGPVPTRLALAALLDRAWRLAPDTYPAFLDALVAASLARADLAAVARLRGAFDTVMKGFTASMERGQGGTTEAAVLDDIFPAEGATRSESELLRRQAQVILSYRDKSPDLGLVRAGVGAATAWACDGTRRARLAGVQNLHATTIFADFVTLMSLACMRMRRHLAQRGMALSAPDAAVMDVPAPALAALVGALDAIARDSAAVTIAKAATLAAVQGVATGTRELVRAEAWYAAMRTWAAGKRPKLDACMDNVEHLQKSLLWSALDAEVLRLPEASPRVQQHARVALASFIDEFRVAYPRRLGELLELITVEAHEVLGHDEVGRLWMLCEPLFEGWARSFDPDVSAKDVVKVLHSHGDILPYDNVNKPRAQRDKEAMTHIDKVFGDRTRCKDGNLAWQAIYGAATRARNDLSHPGNPNGLMGRVTPADLLRETVALLCLASVRFKLSLATRQKTQVTVPDVRCVDLDVG